MTTNREENEQVGKSSSEAKANITVLGRLQSTKATQKAGTTKSTSEISKSDQTDVRGMSAKLAFTGISFRLRRTLWNGLESEFSNWQAGKEQSCRRVLGMIYQGQIW